MNTELIVRAWKDPEFRASLSTEQRAAIPECPSGASITEMSVVDQGDAVGASRDASSTFPDCTFVNTGACHCFQ